MKYHRLLIQVILTLLALSVGYFAKQVASSEVESAQVTSLLHGLAGGYLLATIGAIVLSLYALPRKQPSPLLLGYGPLVGYAIVTFLLIWILQENGTAPESSLAARLFFVPILYGLGIMILLLTLAPSLLPRLALSGLSLAFLLLVAEAAARVYLHNHPVLVGQVFEADSAIGWRSIPNTTYEYSGSNPLCVSFRTQVSINAEGFRDRDHQVSKPAGIVRIAFLGDSIFMAREVAFEERSSQVLEQLLNASNPRYEVFNFGMSGFSIGQYIPLYQTYVAPYQIDWVMALVSELQLSRTNNATMGINMTTNDLPSGNLRPLYHLDEQGQLVNTPPSSEMVTTVNEIIAQRLNRQGQPIFREVTTPPNYQSVDFFEKPYFWLITQSRFLSLLDFYIANLIPNTYQWLANPPADSFSSEVTQLYELDLNYAVLLALNEAVDGKLILLDNSMNPYLQADIERLAAEHHLGYVDIYTPIHAQSGRVDFVCDGHPNAASHRVMAETLYQWLSAASVP